MPSAFQEDRAAGRPLCVDLDGSFLRVDTLHEQLRLVLIKRPGALCRALVGLLKGKACFKRRLAEGIVPDPSLLPVNSAVSALVDEARQQGREVVLVTAADQAIADEVCRRVQPFDKVFASDGITNLSGSRKAALLVEKYGERGFDYVGNAPVDLKVWKHAHKAIVVSSKGRLYREAAAGALECAQAAPSQSNKVKVWIKAIRVHQWVKNLLVFVPLLMAHRLFEAGAFSQTVRAFFAFCFCASSVYLINDLLDLEADRQHPTKKNRPLASGEISVLSVLLVIPLLLLCSVFCVLTLPHRFGQVLGLYFLATLLYSVYLKQVMVADIVVLASLYALRILAGGYAAEVPVSQWLLAFSMFFFLSLACVKRFSELRELRRQQLEANNRRGYLPEDLEQLSQCGVASGYLSVLVLALYVTSGDVAALYSRPALVWLVCPVLLYWISRVWILAGRGVVHEDPIVFAITDRLSYLVGALSALILILAV